MRQELWNHCKISLNHGKTWVWNRGGFFPPGCEALQEAARLDDPGAVVWKGDAQLPLSQQGIKIWGIPVGRRKYIEHFLDVRVTGQAEFLQKIPLVKDLQCAWLLLLYCGVSRANFYVRSVAPEFSLQFAQRHDSQIFACLADLLQVPVDAVPESARAVATLPLTLGGLGMRSSVRLRHAAHWASWADSIKMISERHPEVSTTILRAVDEQHASPSFMGVVSSVQSLEEAGFVPPSWEQLATGAVEVPDVFDPDEPNQPRKGWQATAARAVETHFWEGLMPTLSNRDASLLRSQGGPLASLPLTIFPTNRTCKFDAQLFRILLLRRLRLPLPLTTRWCVCGRHLDNLGHHRAACSVAGILGRRGFPLETAAARICREAGARVRTNVFVRDLD